MFAAYRSGGARQWSHPNREERAVPFTNNTQTHSLTSLSLTGTHTLSLSLSFTHTRILSHSHTHTHSLSLSLTHTHTHTHTHILYNHNTNGWVTTRILKKSINKNHIKIKINNWQAACGGPRQWVTIFPPPHTPPTPTTLHTHWLLLLTKFFYHNISETY